MSFFTVNPTTEQNIKEFQFESEASASAKAELSAMRQRDWAARSFAMRAGIIDRVAELLIANKLELAFIMAMEMGKPIAQGIACAEKCASVCRYYAENSEQILRDESIQTEYSKSYIAYDPIGTILGIMPWNFPFWQVFRFAAPALMSGNSCLLKHAPNTFSCGEAIEQLFIAAGLPEGLFGNLQTDTDTALALIGHPKVAAVTLTGSARAGRAVAANAGKELKKCVLELGGSDPYIILASADIGKAVSICTASRMVNTGQSCIGAKRIIVPKEIARDFAEKLADSVSQYTMGNPMDEAVNLGPLARADLRNNLHNQVIRSAEAGAELLCGGQVPDTKGWFYPPTVLFVANNSARVASSPALTEELFGPVPVVIAAESEAEAISIANNTSFGLGAAVIGSEADAERIARFDLVAGSCAINDFVRSDARLPFGGTKQSGFGRELSSFGIKEFVNAKTICVA